MALKILILLAVAVAVWFITRPRKPSTAKDDTDMVCCERCGVYHAAADPCRCDK